MRTKDQLLLEEAYQKIYLEENDYYVNLNGNVVKKHKDPKITLGGKVTLGGDVVPDENSIESSSLDYEAKLDFLKQIIIRQNEQGTPIKELTEIYYKLEEKDPELFNMDNKSFKNYINNILNVDMHKNFNSGESYVKSESFVHGIQPINEAKKKVNPWAIEKSMEKKTGKKFGKKHKEEIVKGIKKSAKKSGKKITSDKVKAKNK
jgi:hypothetical protein